MIIVFLLKFFDRGVYIKRVVIDLKNMGSMVY